jgi:hypothetical protein
MSEKLYETEEDRIQRQNQESFEGLKALSNAPEFRTEIHTPRPSKESLARYHAAIESIRRARRVTLPDDDLGSKVYRRAT